MHPGELFLRGVTKRHPPPFLLERSERSSMFRLLDARGDLIRRFTRWRYAYVALCALCARAGVQEPTDAECKRLTQEALWKVVREREARRKNNQLRREAKALHDKEAVLGDNNGK